CGRVTSTSPALTTTGPFPASDYRRPTPPQHSTGGPSGEQHEPTAVTPRHTAASVRVVRDLAGLGVLACLSCCRVDLSSPRFDDASHDGVRQLVVCRIVDAPAGGFEVAQRFENGRDDRTAVGVEREELLRTYRRNEALVTVQERRHGVAGAFLGFGHDFAGDGIYALERVPIRPL